MALRDGLVKLAYDTPDKDLRNSILDLLTGEAKTASSGQILRAIQKSLHDGRGTAYSMERDLSGPGDLQAAHQNFQELSKSRIDRCIRILNNMKRDLSSGASIVEWDELAEELWHAARSTAAAAELSRMETSRRLR